MPVGASQCQTRNHSHSIVNKRIKTNIGAGFKVAIVVDTMKNTILNIAVTQPVTDVGRVLARVRPRASDSRI